MGPKADEMNPADTRIQTFPFQNQYPSQLKIHTREQLSSKGRVTELMRRKPTLADNRNNFLGRSLTVYEHEVPPFVPTATPSGSCHLRTITYQ